MQNWIDETKIRRFKKYNVYSDLRVYTTIDSRMQTYAEESMDEHLTNLQKEFQTERKIKQHLQGDLTEDETSRIMRTSISAVIAGENLKKQGEVRRRNNSSFKKETKMRIFTWRNNDHATTL
jgi:penicillin-binding protein 1A